MPMHVTNSFLSSLTVCAFLFACGGQVTEGDASATRQPAVVDGAEKSTTTAPLPASNETADGPGFTVRDAWFRDGKTPYGQDVKQIVLASFAGSCDPVNAAIGERTLFIGLPADSEPTVGTAYPVAGVQARWTVISLACTGMSLEQVYIDGTVTITKVDDTVVEGKLEGTLLDTDETKRTLEVPFSASRCAHGQGACQP